MMIHPFRWTPGGSDYPRVWAFRPLCGAGCGAPCATGSPALAASEREGPGSRAEGASGHARARSEWPGQWPRGWAAASRAPRASRECGPASSAQLCGVARSPLSFRRSGTRPGGGRSGARGALSSTARSRSAPFPPRRRRGTLPGPVSETGVCSSVPVIGLTPRPAPHRSCG